MISANFTGADFRGAEFIRISFEKSIVVNAKFSSNSKGMINKQELLAKGAILDEI